jgi:plasmid stabilization system protein ParE
VSARYVVRPKADQDLDDQAYYYATVASPEVGHRFLVAAHETFALLATQPQMGWHFRLTTYTDSNSSLPVLSPMFSTETPSLSSSVR